MNVAPSEHQARLGCPLLLLLLLSMPVAAAEIRIDDVANDGCRNEPRLRVTFDKYCHRHVHKPREEVCGGGGGSGGGSAGGGSSGGFFGGSAGNGSTGLGGLFTGGGSGGGGGMVGIGSPSSIGGGTFNNGLNGLTTINSPPIVPPVAPVPGPVVGRGLIGLIICVFLFLAWRKHVKHSRAPST